jgi:peptide deformylase
MDAELLYRTKLREIEREAQRIRLISAAKEARHRPSASKAEEGCLSIPRLLRTLRPASS